MMFIIVVAAPLLRLSSATDLFHDDFSEPVQTSGNWVFDESMFGWNRSLYTANKLVTQTDSAMFMAGDSVFAAYKPCSFTTGSLGGSYTVEVTWSPSILVPMDEDIAVAVCNVDPNSLTTEEALTLTARNVSGLFSHTRPLRMISDKCVGAQMHQARWRFTTISPVLSVPPSPQLNGPRGCDYRAATDTDGEAITTMSLEISPMNATFVTGLASCDGVTQPMNGVFDPTQPAWIYVMVEDLNLHFVEIERVAVKDAGGGEVWAEDFSDKAAAEAAWFSPHLNLAGCVGVGYDGPDGQDGVVFIVNDSFIELHGALIVLQAVTPVTATDFAVELDFMPDWLAPVTTSNDVSILICTIAGLTTWSLDGRPECAQFNMQDELNSGFIKTATAGGTVYGREIGAWNRCPTGQMSTMQIVVTADTIIFKTVHADSSYANCADIVVPNPFREGGAGGAGGGSGSPTLYIYLAVDDSNYLWTTVLDFRIASVPTDLAAQPRFPEYVFTPVQCNEWISMWFWYETGTCGPNAAGETGLFQNQLGPIRVGGQCNNAAGGNFRALCAADGSKFDHVQVDFDGLGVQGCNPIYGIGPSFSPAVQAIAQLRNLSTGPFFTVFNSVLNGESDGSVLFGKCYEILDTAATTNLQPSARCTNGQRCASVLFTGQCPIPPPPSPSRPPPPSQPPPPSPPPPVPEPPVPPSSPSPSFPPSSADDGLSGGATAGIVTGAVIGSLLLGAVAVFLTRKWIFAPQPSAKVGKPTPAEMRGHELERNPAQPAETEEQAPEEQTSEMTNNTDITSS